MQCMKCGVEIPEGQVFCESCLEIMERYPVKPGTPVQILPRIPKDKGSKRRELSPEELLSKQRSVNRRQRLLIWLLVVALACTIGVLIYALLPQFNAGMV